MLFLFLHVWRDLLTVEELELFKIVCGHRVGQADDLIDKVTLSTNLHQSIVVSLDFSPLPDILSPRILG